VGVLHAALAIMPDRNLVRPVHARRLQGDHRRSRGDYLGAAENGGAAKAWRLRKRRWPSRRKEIYEALHPETRLRPSWFKSSWLGSLAAPTPAMGQAASSIAPMVETSWR
jgi:hypothetical protein